MNIEQAQAVVRNLPPFVSVVALFVNENEQTIREILRQVPIDVIQFHGDEDDDFCRRFDRPYLKAVRVQSAADIQTACAKFPNARALLFDAYHPTEYGGTGQSFDWTMLHGNIGKPWILARRIDCGKRCRSGKNQWCGGGGCVRRCRNLRRA